MATRKSRTSPAAGSAAKSSKPTSKKKATTKKAAAAPAVEHPAAADGKAATALRPRGRFRARAPLAPEPEINEAELEQSIGGKAAGKHLVIVESPTKSKTLHKFLGKDYLVLASNGHVKDLPKSKLGVDIDNNFEPEYE